MATVPLDEVSAPNGVNDVDFLKIDTEGFEKEVLAGGETIISEKALGVICEAYFLFALFKVAKVR